MSPSHPADPPGTPADTPRPDDVPHPAVPAAARPPVDEVDEVDEPEGLTLGGSARWWVVGGVLVALAVALATWIGLGNARDAVTYRDVGFHVDSPAQVTSWWEVTKPKDKQVTCLVRALDSTFGVVGAVDVVIPAGVESASRRTQIRTTSPAVTGTVRSCTITG